MKQILIVRVNNKIITESKTENKIVKNFIKKFPDYNIIFDFVENDKDFNGYWFKLELVK